MIVFEPTPEGNYYGNAATADDAVFCGAMSKANDPTAPRADDTLAQKLRPTGGGVYASFVEYTQRPSTRHAAIPRNLSSLPHYKMWADKMRRDWLPDDDNG